MKIKRYDVYYADLNPTIGGELIKVRPVVIVSKTEMEEQNPGEMHPKRCRNSSRSDKDN